MNKKLIAFILILLVLSITGVVVFKIYHGHLQQAALSAQKYTCSMHPYYISNKPGNCPICGMALVPVKKENPQNNAAAPTERKIAYYRDAMKPWITSDKPGKASDGMDLIPVYEDETSGAGIKIDPSTIQNIGVVTEEVVNRNLKKVIRTSGTINFNEQKIFSVNSKITGWAEKLYVDYNGQKVYKGQPLFSLYSPDLVSAQNEYLQALRSLKSAGANERASALSFVDASKRKLLYWDIPESEIAKVESLGVPQKALNILSSANGIIMEKSIVQGQNITAGTELYRIVDLSEVWVMADVYQEDLAFVKETQTADIDVSYVRSKTFHGTITYISPMLDMSSKTAKVRIVVQNTSAFDLKPGMFASVTINSPVSFNSIAVPEQAIIRSGKRNIVVISLGNGRFEPREIKLGVSAEGYVQVLQGLHQGEKIVTSSQFLIDSESSLKTAIQKMTGNAEEESTFIAVSPQ